MKKLTLIAIAVLCVFLLMRTAHAQQVDAAFGMGTLVTPSASSASGSYSAVSEGGGVYPSFSGDFLLKRHFGVNGELAWRGSQATYPGFLVPYRPLFWDFNGVYVPQFGKHLAAELMGGIGAEDLRFYVAPSCGVGCTNFVSSNHFMGHFGGGIRYYVFGNFFVRPEAHLYLIRNNYEFSSARATRLGVSIGYSFGR